MKVLSLLWGQNGNLIRGVDSSGVMLEGLVNQGIVFPGQTTIAQLLTLYSSARYDGLGETLTNVKFYLDGDADSLAVIQDIWPDQGGGLQISFDHGLNYFTFKQGPDGIGDKNYPSTWLSFSESYISIISGAPTTIVNTGTIYAVEDVQILVRLIVPAQANQFKIYLPVLQVDVDIV